jgi:Zn-dependent peptidase ImmA (M78 family)
VRTFALLLAIAAVGAWGKVHPSDMERSVWPALPTQVQGLAGPITVKITVGLKDEEGAELWGSWEQNKRLIEIDSEATPEFRWHTLGHELCHAVLGDAGYVNTIEASQQEALCDAFGSARVQEMRR